MTRNDLLQPQPELTSVQDVAALLKLNPHIYRLAASHDLSLDDLLKLLPELLSTEDAARLLLRKPQTLRKWACLENGPIRPIRINGRLAWLTREVLILRSGTEMEANHD